MNTDTKLVPAADKKPYAACKRYTEKHKAIHGGKC